MLTPESVTRCRGEVAWTKVILKFIIFLYYSVFTFVYFIHLFSSIYIIMIHETFRSLILHDIIDYVDNFN